MTISKKLLIVPLLALGLQLTTAAYFSESMLKTEITSILHFMDTLRKEETKAAQKTVQLLEKEFRNEKTRYEWELYTLNDIDVIDMARIIGMNSTTDAKIAAILVILAQKESAKELHIKKEIEQNHKNYILKKEIEQNRKDYILGFIAAGVMGAAFYYC